MPPKSSLFGRLSLTCGAPGISSQDCIAMERNNADQLLWLEVFSGDFYGHNYGKRYDNVAREKKQSLQIPISLYSFTSVPI